MCKIQELSMSLFAKMITISQKKYSFLEAFGIKDLKLSPQRSKDFPIRRSAERERCGDER
jgi:hypothetical protein